MRGTLEERFWAKVEKTETCWLWRASGVPRGYGHFGVRRNGRQRMEYAHRVSWEIANGPVPDGMVVRHLVCDNPPCVRPDHLAIGTTLDNATDAKLKGRIRSGDQHGLRLHPERVKVLRGEQSLSAKLTRVDVLAIRERYGAGGIGMRALGREFGIGYTETNAIIHRRKWAHVE